MLKKNMHKHTIETNGCVLHCTWDAPDLDDPQSGKNVWTPKQLLVAITR